jgi:hypothetical protein
VGPGHKPVKNSDSISGKTDSESGRSGSVERDGDRIREKEPKRMRKREWEQTA